MSQESKSERKNLITEWILSELTEKPAEGIRIQGSPHTVNYRNWRAVAFNGSTDVILLDSMPLAGLEQFTIEAIINPGSGGSFEQRFLHFGEVQGDRVLMETRSTQTDWYFDAFIKAGEQQSTLIDQNLLHPLDQWYHLAYVIDHGKLETYVNGKKELETRIDMIPLQGGKTSIGARQNEVSWFKGAIYKIRVSSKVLNPVDFMGFNNIS